MENVTEGENVTLITNRIAIGKSDARAAAVLLWIENEWPDITQGETDDLLNAAIWWSVFFGAADKANQLHSGNGGKVDKGTK